MKTLEDLRKISYASALKLNLKDTNDGIRVVVGMATCGITAGAKPVFSTLTEELAIRKLDNVVVTQVGCIGECALEPIVEVYDNKGNRTTYAKVNTDVAKQIIETHLINKQILSSNVIENFR